MEQWGEQSNAPTIEADKAGLLSHKTTRPTWRRFLSSKGSWLAVIMVMLSFGLILGLSIGLTVGRKHSKQGSAQQAGQPVPPANNDSNSPQPLASLVDLGYVKYQGDTYQNGISQWVGIRYAQPPIGNLRFAAPQNVTGNGTLEDATQRLPHCIGTRVNLDENILSGGAGEDCLNLDIYAPGNTTTDSKLPVYFFLQGGGFNDASPLQNGSTLVQASGGDIIVVAINYRVSAYGFLASSEIQANGSLNNGLKDQRMALQWVHNYIDKFGGDPNHVVLGGESAGAGSVTLQLAAYGGQDDGLFHATVAESQSFGALRSVAESQYQYDELINRTHCTPQETGNNDTLACLRSLNETSFQTYNTATRFPNTSADPLFAYNPTLDNDFLPDYTLNLFASGRFLKLPAIYGDVSNEGTVFVPRVNQSTGTINGANAWLQAQFPLLNSSELASINSLYPPETQDFYGASTVGEYWLSTSTAYGDIRYVCPGFYLNNQTAHYASSVGNWNYHYNVTDPEQIRNGLGVPHIAEQNALWDTKVDSYNTTNAPIVSLVQNYWISFIRSFNPNTHRASGAPAWQQWTSSGGGQRLLIQDPGPDGSFDTTTTETVSADQNNKCTTLLGWGVAIKQ